MTGNARRLAIGGLVGIFAWLAPMGANACEPLGFLYSLLVQEQRVHAADAQRFIVERAGQPMSVTNGMPLCGDDRLATRTDTTAIVRVGPAEGPQHDLTMRPGSTMILRAVNRVELLLGRLFAALQGQFDVVMPLARLAAAGTEFEVAVTEEGCTVDQLEGATDLSSGTGGSTRISRLRGAACSTGTAPQVTELDLDRCKSLIEAQSRTIIQARPATSSINTIKQFNPAEAPAIFAEARQEAVCSDDAAAKVTLDQLLVDWQEPQEALRGLRERAAPDQLALGRALVMRGQSAEAIEQFRRAIVSGGTTAAAVNGVGDAERDLGLAAVRTGNAAQVAQHFESAQRQYLAALGQTQDADEIGVILVNLGDLALLRTKLDPGLAESRLTEAQRYYERARAHGDPPHARLGIARISLLRAQLIPTQQIDTSEGNFGEVLAASILLGVLAEQQRKPHREAARRELRELLAGKPGFAPGEELLGETLYALGDGGDARRHLVQAIASDPTHTSAYRTYAATLSGGNKRLYERTYRLVEVAAVRVLDDVRDEILMPTTPAVTIPTAPLTADVEALSFAAPPRKEKVVTLTNRSNAPATADAVSITGPNANAFRIVSSGCTGVSVVAQGQCRIVVLFSAEQVGTYRATLEISGSGGQWKREVRLRGEVIQLPPIP